MGPRSGGRDLRAVLRDDARGARGRRHVHPVARVVDTVPLRA
jgi:hypothetical protein